MTALRHALLACVLLGLSGLSVGQQPYNDCSKAYAAAEELVGTWTRGQVANITVYGGTAPGHVPFTAKDGE